jgi:hypothetical protein
VLCGRGLDVATVDGLDRVAPDCEVVTRQASRDPYRNGESQHETEVEPDSAAFGKKVVAVFQVGRIFDGGARNIGFATSRDSGRTWKRGFLRGLAPRASDPVVAYDRRHGVWLATSIVFGNGPSAIVVNRSADGLRWGNPVTAVATPQFGQDKEWIACDNWPQSPYYGRCYLSYSQTITEEVVVKTSSDGGLTWGPETTAPGHPGRASIRGEFAPAVQPLVLPSGRALVAYYDAGAMSVLRSDDGGATWIVQAAVAPARYAPHRVSLRAAPLPTSTVDRDGRAYLAWPDCSFRPGCAANDVAFTSTTDGIAWTPPQRVPTGAGDAQLPGLDADPARSGRLALAYYVLRGSALDVRFVWSRDGGVTWSRPQRLNARPVPISGIASTSLGPMVGDYISTSIAGGRAVPVFALAGPARGTKLREAIFASSLRVP